MREIKFRIWVPMIKKFIYVGPDNYYCAEYSGLLFKSDSDGADPTYEDGYHAEEDAENCTLQQFTGLHDKNGKEIYEGDITKGNHDTLGIIKYENFGFVIEALPYYENGILYDQPNYTHKDNHLEVIGNIYENPELLEPHHETKK